MARTIVVRSCLRGEASTRAEPKDAPQPQGGTEPTTTEQTTTEHEAPSAFPLRPDDYPPRDECSVNHPASTQFQIRESPQSQRRDPSAPHARRDSRDRANNAKMPATSRPFAPSGRAAG